MVVLLLIGVLKFTPGEAAVIQPLVTQSPLIPWLYGLLSLQGCSNVIGAIEIAIVATAPKPPRNETFGTAGDAPSERRG